MLDLSGLEASVVRIGDELGLHWHGNDRTVHTDFDRFRPIRVRESRTSGSLDVTWGDFGDLPMTDHFFKPLCERAAELTFTASPFPLDFDMLATVGRQQERLPFSGATFHMARTGSTLIHRMFSRTGKVHSLSEVTLFDEAARHMDAWPEARRSGVIRDLVGVFQRPRRPNERYFTLKMTDAMSGVCLPSYREAFPSVPWIFVYRDPVEVMVSALRRPTGMMENWFHNRTNAANRLSMPELADPSMWPPEFMARTLERICANAVKAARTTPEGKFLAVSYKRLPEALWETIAPHFGIELSTGERALMEDEAKYHAKRVDPTEFRPDSETKQQSASKTVQELAARFVAPWIEQLQVLPQG